MKVRLYGQSLDNSLPHGDDLEITYPLCRPTRLCSDVPVRHRTLQRYACLRQRGNLNVPGDPPFSAKASRTKALISCYCWGEDHDPAQNN